ncbi:MAG: MMPL family transporter [Thermoleophilia bacterium]|nr:MMPL family transporter [Thermoleophilia bacterium]
MSSQGTSRIGNIAARVAGRRAKWFVIAIWVLLAVASGPVQGLLEEKSTNSSTNFLPESADSTKVAELVDDTAVFDTGEAVPAIIVFQSPGGKGRIDSAQEQRIRSFLDGLRTELDTLPTATSLTTPFDTGGPPTDALRSEDGSTLLAFVSLESPDFDQLDEAVNTLRDRTSSLDDTDLDIYVSGPAALASDAAAAFAGIDGKLLLGTSILVLVLLLLIYRSPLVALVPLVAVGFAAALSRALLGLAIDPFDLVVSGQTSGIMLILIFGAGTDYCLLIVARYREELVRYEDPHDAMRETVRHTTPAILSSAGTVLLAMLVLLFADLRSTSSLGPALIIGVSIAMLAGLTLLPALLLALGRRSFWPSIPRYGDDTAGRIRLWPRLADAVAARPRRWLGAVTVVLLVFASGILAYDNSPTSDVDIFIDKPESTQGLQALRSKLPPGELAQGTVLVGTGDPASLEAATGAIVGELQQHESVATAFPAARGRDGDTSWQQITFAPSSNPYGQDAVDSIETLRRDLERAAPDGVQVLVGGPTAQTADAQSTNRRDLMVIVPGVLLVIFVVLVVLLRAVVAPLLLVATVVLGFLATLGICWVLFLGILGYPGIDPGTITFIFLFTAALGVDYNIFLVARIREEFDRGSNTVDATTTALATTGGVITSAGVILAGTFLILAALPLLPLRELGIAVAIGVLLDTVLVRAMLVPSALVLLRERSWWPSARSHGD